MYEGESTLWVTLPHQILVSSVRIYLEMIEKVEVYRDGSAFLFSILPTLSTISNFSTTLAYAS